MSEKLVEIVEGRISSGRFSSSLGENLSPNRIFAQDYYIERGESIISFEALMVITFKTLIDMGERGTPVAGLLCHGLTMAEKAASGAYVDRACIMYDAAVRQRALKMGYTAFGEPIYEDLIRCFSLENSRKFESKPTHGGRKKKNICFRYNSDAGCTSKDCIYSHKCSACKMDGHPASACKVGDRGKSSK